MTDRVGQRLGNYRLTRLLGRGSFAEVYLGEHLRLHTQAAVKVLYTQLATPADVEGFEKEAQTIAHLKHPHIVRVLDFDVQNDTPFLVMDYASNATLRQRHPKGTILPFTTIIAYVKQVTDALQYAHNQRVIHRDVKPENMLVGQRDEVLLSDFGIATIAHHTSSQGTEAMAGTVPYMAPEQIQGHPRTASDQYSLGIVVYEWLTGDRPFGGSPMEIATQHLFAPPPSLCEKVPTILPAIQEVVQIALAKDVHRRFASVQAFATAFEQASQVKQTRLLGLPNVEPAPSQPLQPVIPEIVSPSQRLSVPGTLLPEQSAPLPIPVDLHDEGTPTLYPAAQLADIGVIPIPTWLPTPSSRPDKKPSLFRWLHRFRGTSLPSTSIAHLLINMGLILVRGFFWLVTPPIASLRRFLHLLAERALSIREMWTELLCFPKLVGTFATLVSVAGLLFIIHIALPNIDLDNLSTLASLVVWLIAFVVAIFATFVCIGIGVVVTNWLINRRGNRIANRGKSTSTLSPHPEIPAVQPILSQNVPPARFPGSIPNQSSQPSAMQQSQLSAVSSQMPPPATRPSRMNVRTILLIGLALLLIASGLGLFASIQSNQLAASNAIATATAQANSTATAVAGNAIAIQKAIDEAHATATAYQDLYNTSASGSPVLSDPLSDNSKGNGWTKDTHCRFTGAAYHVSITHTNFLWSCNTSTDFSNFAYQVQMKIIKGDDGGVTFRSNSVNGTYYGYVFAVGQDGSYKLCVFPPNATTCNSLRTGSSGAINQGLNQTNLVTVIVKGSTITLYVNQQEVNSMTDNTFSHGQIGVIADDISNPTEVIYSNAKVWKL